MGTIAASTLELQQNLKTNYSDWLLICILYLDLEQGYKYRF